MKIFLSVITHGILVSLVSALSSSANPDPPTAFPVLSEIQVTDSFDWNVEVDARACPGLVTYPCATDTFSLFCWQSTTPPPADSFRRPGTVEQFDTRGIAVLTPQHFPNLRLKKGSTLFLQYKLAYSGGTAQDIWQALIPANLSSQQSVVGSMTTHCCLLMGAVCQMTCPTTVYSISNSPTIGQPNNGSGVSSPRSVMSKPASVRLLAPKLRGQIPVAVSGNPSGKGMIDIFSPDGSQVRLLSFDCSGPGTYTIRWDGNNEQDRTVPAGTYVCRVRLGKDVVCKGFIVW